MITGGGPTVPPPRRSHANSKGRSRHLVRIPRENPPRGDLLIVAIDIGKLLLDSAPEVRNPGVFLVFLFLEPIQSSRKASGAPLELLPVHHPAVRFHALRYTVALIHERRCSAR